MVSPQRSWEKINRMESKILAYRRLIDEGRFPEAQDVINFHDSRLGKEVNEVEKARAVQAIEDLKADIIKNLEKLGITLEDYLTLLKERKADILILEFKEEKKSKKEEEKDA